MLTVFHRRFGLSDTEETKLEKYCFLEVRMYNYRKHGTNEPTVTGPFAQMYEDQRPEIKYSGVFPVCEFRVGFSGVGRKWHCGTVLLDWLS